MTPDEWEAWDRRNFSGVWGCPVCGCDTGHNQTMHELHDKREVTPV